MLKATIAIEQSGIAMIELITVTEKPKGYILCTPFDLYKIIQSPLYPRAFSPLIMGAISFINTSFSKSIFIWLSNKS